MKNHLVFDIETTPDLSVPFSSNDVRMIGRDVEYKTEMEIRDARPFPPAACHEVVCVGYAMLEDYVPKIIKIAGVKNEDLTTTISEEDQLRGFWKYLEALKPSVVGFNSRGFDIPVLTMRAMKYGMTLPWWFTSRNTRYRYADLDAAGTHIDLMDHLSDFGASRKHQMGHVANLLGMPGKPEGIDGSKVGEMIAKGHLALVRAYCLSDVLQTTIIFLRYELLRSAIDLPLYQKAVSALHELVTIPLTFETQNFLPAGFLDRMDWNRAMLLSPPKVEVQVHIQGNGKWEHAPEFVDDGEPKPNSPADLGFVK